MHGRFLFFEIYELHIRLLRYVLSAGGSQRGSQFRNDLLAGFAFSVSVFQRFLDITDCIRYAMESHKTVQNPDVAKILETEKEVYELLGGYR